MKAMYECEGNVRELEVIDFYAEIAQELVKEPLDKTKTVFDLCEPGNKCV